MTGSGPDHRPAYVAALLAAQRQADVAAGPPSAWRPSAAERLRRRLRQAAALGVAGVVLAFAGDALWTRHRLAADGMSPAFTPRPAHAALPPAGNGAIDPATADAGHGAPASALIEAVEDRLRLDLVDADRRQAIERLAELTGSRLFGIGLLPRDLGTVTLQVAAIDLATAWQRLLHGAPSGFAIACGPTSCRVSFAAVPDTVPAASNERARQAASLDRRYAVESTEGEN